ncbi:MAG: ABC transporter substrate-binding protein [Acetobacteraceae bacterium]
MQITRRSTLGGVLAGALAVPAIRSAHAAPGVLRIAIGTSLSRLDPLLTTIGDEYIYDNLVFNGLTRMAEDLSIQPDLAESWSYTPDLKQWTFRLRHGVKFHDGREMVADDVVALYRRLLDPANAAPSRSNYDMVAAVDAADAYTVVFHLSSPYGGFADILSDRQAKIVPRDATAQLATKPIGTGPFKFVSYTPGDRLILARNPDYFEPGMPKLDGVELRIIPEMSVKLAALQAGDIDVVWDLPLDQVKQLSGRGDLRVDSVPSGSWDAAIMNNLIPPFNNPKVRLAFQMAVDKADVVELTLFGQGAPTISPIPSTHAFYAHDITIPPADPAAARKLLAEAAFRTASRCRSSSPSGARCASGWA